MSSGSHPGGGRRSSREVRELVLAAARDAFAARPYDAVSTRDIAAEAGVSPTVIFRHFGSKQALHEHATGAAPPPDPPTGHRAANTDARERIVEAARTLFAARGYARTSTRDIARAAGVHETYLFRYFETKAGLFRVAILDPFGAFIRAYAAEVPPREDAAGVQPASEDFVAGLAAVLRERRGELLTLVATRLHEGDEVVDMTDQQAAMSEILDPLVARVRDEQAARGHTGVDEAVATRLVIAMLGGVAIFRDWLFPDDAGIDDDAIVAEATAFVAAGLRRGSGPA